MSQIEFGIHTLDIKHRISRMEAKDIKTIFGIKMNEKIKTTAYHNKGINQIEIVETCFPDGNGGLKSSYILNLQINPSHMLNISKYKILPATLGNINKMIVKLNNILSNDFHLSLTNSDCRQWTLDRSDFAFDVKVHNAPIMIRILNQALKVNQKNCFRHSFKTAHPKRIIYQSVRFKNKSYIYNIYDKLQQLMDEHYVLTPDEQIYFNNIVRIEKQIFDKGVNNCVGTPKKFSLLQDKAVIDKIKNDILQEIKLFFGTGKYVTHQITTQTIKNSHFNHYHQAQMIQTVTFISKYGMAKTLDEIRKYAMQNKLDIDIQLKDFNILLHDIESLGISPSGILVHESIEINTSTLPNIIEILSSNNTILKKSRRKLPFGKIYIDHPNKRYKCNFTFHPFDKGSDRTSYADADRDRLEKKILNKLIGVYRDNMISAQNNSSSSQTEILHKSRQDLLNFGKVAKCPEVLKHIKIEIYNTEMEDFYD